MSNEAKISLTLPKGKGDKRLYGLRDFAVNLIKIRADIGFKISSRGWCYQLEGFGLITKAQFSRVENIINECRRIGFLPIDFTAEEEGRKFSGVEKPTEVSPLQWLKKYLEAALVCEDWYTPDWWDEEEYYIQMIVEKIDLKTLFSPVCKEFHIPIATTKGWSSMLQRAEYARRFREAEDMGLTCVLLYCGDHDPDGLRISDFLRKNLMDLWRVRWEDGAEGYNPNHLIIDRFGLDFEFIEENNLSWINNLITGSKKDLASPSHPNYNMPYVQEYLAKFGARKCEANALVTNPDAAQKLCRSTIESYLREGALDRFAVKTAEVEVAINDFREKLKLDETLKGIVKLIDEETEKEEKEDEEE